MSWNQGGPGYYPPPDPNQGYGGYGGQPVPGAPPPQGYPGGMPPQGYPGGMPPQGYPGGMPPQGYPGGGMPPQGYPGGGFQPGAPPAGFMPPPPYAGGPPMFQPDQSGKAENRPINLTQHGYGTPGQDVEGDVKGFDFNDRSIRHGFIRKVYSILMVQLSITMGFIALFMYHQPTKNYVQQHPEMWWIALVIMIVCLITMACCGDVRRKAPMNFVFLGLFTFAEAFMLGMAASNFDEQAVLISVGITTAVCLGLTLFAFQTKWDFTVMGGVLLVLSIVLLLFGIIAIFVKIKILTLVYASLGVLLFSFYLIYDTQLMLGGKHKYSVSPEEYIFAALNLYLDIINIFLYILTLVGASRD